MYFKNTCLEIYCEDFAFIMKAFFPKGILLLFQPKKSPKYAYLVKKVQSGQLSFPLFICHNLRSVFYVFYA